MQLTELQLSFSQPDLPTKGSHGHHHAQGVAGAPVVEAGEPPARIQPRSRIKLHQARHSTPCLTKTAVVMTRDLGVHHKYNTCLAGGFFVRASIGWYPLHRAFYLSGNFERLTYDSSVLSSQARMTTAQPSVGYVKLRSTSPRFLNAPPQQCRCADLHQPIAHLPCHTRQYWELRPLGGSDRRAPLKARALDVGSRPCTGDSGSVLGRRRSRLVGRRRAAT